MEDKAIQPGALIRRVRLGDRDCIVVKDHDGGQATIAIDTIVGVRSNYLGAAVIDVSTAARVIPTIHTWDEVMEAIQHTETP